MGECLRHNLTVIVGNSVSILMNGLVSSCLCGKWTINFALKNVGLNLSLFHVLSLVIRILVLHQVVVLVLNDVAVWMLEVIGHNVGHLWCVVHRSIWDNHLLLGVWRSVNSWNISRVIAHSSVHWIESHILSLGFSMKVSGESASPPSSAVSLPDAPFIVSARVLNVLINISNEPSSINRWDILGSLSSNIASVLAWVLPKVAIFWNSSHFVEFGTNRQAWREFAMWVSITMSKSTIENCAFCATIRPLGTSLWDWEGMLDDLRWVCNSAIAQVNWAIRQHLITVNNLIRLCQWQERQCY